MKHRRFIICAGDGVYGHWGSGSTINAARQNFLRAGGKRKVDYAIWEFTSDLPFAPSEREANEDESDAYVATDGSLCWVRCEPQQLA